MTLEEALEQILELKNEKQSLQEQIEQFTISNETLTADKENLSNEVNRLKQKNFEYFERLSSQFDKQETLVTPSNEPTQEEGTTLEDVINSFN